MTIRGTVLVLNAGSSSVKFALYDSGADGALAAGPSGRIEGIGVIGAWLREHATTRPLVAVGHRVVHGGRAFAGAAAPRVGAGGNGHLGPLCDT